MVMPKISQEVMLVHDIEPSDNPPCTLTVTTLITPPAALIFTST